MKFPKTKSDILKFIFLFNQTFKKEKPNYQCATIYDKDAENPQNLEAETRKNNWHFWLKIPEIINRLASD